MNTNKFDDQDDAPIIRSLSIKNSDSILGPITSNSLLSSPMAGRLSENSNSPTRSSSSAILIGHRSPVNSSGRNSTSNEICGLDVVDGETLFGGRLDAFGRAGRILGSFGESGMKSYENLYLNKRKLSSKNEDQCSLIENMSCIANVLDSRLDEEVFDYENNTEHYQKKKVISLSSYKYSSSSDKSDFDLISFTDTDSISLANDCDGGGGGEDENDRKDENEKKHHHSNGKYLCFCAAGCSNGELVADQLIYPLRRSV